MSPPPSTSLHLSSGNLRNFLRPQHTENHPNPRLFLKTHELPRNPPRKFFLNAIGIPIEFPTVPLNCPKSPQFAPNPIIWCLMVGDRFIVGTPTMPNPPRSLIKEIPPKNVLLRERQYFVLISKEHCKHTWWIWWSLALPIKSSSIEAHQQVQARHPPPGDLFLYTSPARCCPFWQFSGSGVLKIFCPKDPEFYTPLVLSCQRRQQLLALVVYKHLQRFVTHSSDCFWMAWNRPTEATKTSPPMSPCADSVTPCSCSLLPKVSRTTTHAVLQAMALRESGGVGSVEVRKRSVDALSRDLISFA